MLRVALISSTRNTVLNKIVISSDDGGWSRRLPQPLCFLLCSTCAGADVAALRGYESGEEKKTAALFRNRRTGGSRGRDDAQ